MTTKNRWQDEMNLETPMRLWHFMAFTGGFGILGIAGEQLQAWLNPEEAIPAPWLAMAIGCALIALPMVSRLKEKKSKDVAK